MHKISQRIVLLLASALMATGLMAVAVSPAEAAAPTVTAQVASVQSTPTATHKPRVLGPHSAAMDVGWCGWNGPCIRFSRSEQGYISSVSLFTAAAFIALASPAAGVVAGAIAVVIQRYIDNRGGICPKSAPTMEVTISTSPRVLGCKG